MSKVIGGLIWLLCLTASLRATAASQQAEVQTIRNIDAGTNGRPKNSKQYQPLVEDPALLEGKKLDFFKQTISAKYLAELMTHKRDKTSIHIEFCCIDGTLDLSNKKTCGLYSESCLFTGDILLNGAKVEGGFVLEKDEIIEGRFSANDTEFFGTVLFYSTSFKDGVEFSAAKFDEDVAFIDVEITGVEGIANTEATFKGSRFRGHATFTNTHFRADTYFDNCEFARDVMWDGSHFDGEADFSDAVFLDSVSFRDVGIVSSLTFSHTQFPGLALFDGVHTIPDPEASDKSGQSRGLDASELSLHGVRFLGPVSFDGIRVGRLMFPTNLSPIKSQPPRPVLPLRCKESVSFRGLKCKEADFSGAIFEGTADFSRASFEKRISFRQTVFRDSAFFGDTIFPASGLILDRVLFAKRAVLSAEQLNHGQIADNDEPGLWENLELAFRNSGNIEAMNEATYQKGLIKMNALKGSLSDRASYIIWGFGVRPWRTIGCMLGLFGVFYVGCVLCSSRIKVPLPEESEEQKLRAEGMRVLREVERRLVPPGNASAEPTKQSESSAPTKVSRYQIAFDYARNSVLKPFYGWEHTTSRPLGATAMGVWVLMAALAVCLFQVLSNVSPFVRELVGKILPL